MRSYLYELITVNMKTTIKQKRFGTMHVFSFNFIINIFVLFNNFVFIHCLSALNSKYIEDKSWVSFQFNTSLVSDFITVRGFGECNGKCISNESCFAFEYKNKNKVCKFYTRSGLNTGNQGQYDISNTFIILRNSLSK